MKLKRGHSEENLRGLGRGIGGKCIQNAFHKCIKSQRTNLRYIY